MITAASFPLGMMYPEFSNQNNDSYTGRNFQPDATEDQRRVWQTPEESKTLRIHSPYGYLPREH
jgi:hypothetical protein